MNRNSWRCFVALVLAVPLFGTVATTKAAELPNVIPNGDFSRGELGSLPTGWTQHSARPGLAPRFALVQRDGSRALQVDGAGNPDCVGYVSTKALLAPDKTYRFRVVFRVSDGLNPHDHLLFQCFVPGARDGIFDLHRRADGWIGGDAKIRGGDEAEVRILFRLSADGKAWIRDVSLVETEPVEPRWVKVACTQGKTDANSAEAVIEAAAKENVDLVLLPEYMAGGRIEETVPGPSSKLMSEAARRHDMYVAGGIVRKVPEQDRVYNTALLFDRRGRLAGTYDKVHPYSPEINEQGISAGTRVPVFQTDFGKVGFIICYDSWFTDVTELLALKGAEIVLFPNAGYYRSLMPARAADNGVRIVASSWNSGNGVWDTIGREVRNPDADPTHKPVRGTTFANVVQVDVGTIKMLVVSLDLNCSPSPAYNGGTMYSAPGGERNRRCQKVFLEGPIQQERERWAAE